MTKLEKLRAALPEEADGLLVTSEINIRYLTDFSYTDGFVFVTRDKAYAYTDFRYIEAANAKVNRDYEVRMFERGRSGTIEKVIDECGCSSVAFEAGTMSYADAEDYKAKVPSVRWIPARGLIETLREVKDEKEIAAMERAQRIAEKAFDQILGFISPDRTEREIALELEYYMRKYGSEGVSFDTIAVSGTASALPHGVPRDCKLERGFLTMDFGAVCDSGYRSDMTRTVCIGKPDEEQKKVYDTVLRAQLAALEGVRGGMKGVEVDKIARDIITEAGYGKCFGHSLGHSVGLEIHEAPNFSPNAGERIVVPGNVITFEPGIYLEGRYGVRIEDMGVITEDGVRNLTNCPKELIIL